MLMGNIYSQYIRISYRYEKNSLPGGQSQCSLQRTIGGALGLVTGLSARMVSSAFTEWPTTQFLLKVPVKLSIYRCH